jgi:SAM-dependent methyltransferase
MADDRATALFFELFDGLPRQGPGDAASTLRALALVPGVGPQSRILDVGCGTGLQSRVLARSTRARVVAVDNHPPFVEELHRQALALGLGDRIEAHVADMRELDFAPGSFDLIWSEGAIYVMGFEAGLREWRRLLAPGGHLAVTEVCWTRPDPPPAFRDRHRGEADAQGLADLVQREIDVWRRYNDCYAYEFFVTRGAIP